MDNYFRDRSTGLPVTRDDIQKSRINLSIPRVLAKSTLDNLNLDVVKETPKPADDAIRYYVWRPYELADGTFVQDWVPTYRFPLETLLEPYRAFLIGKVSEQHKYHRDKGIVFDGLMVGTDLQARHIIAMSLGKGSQDVVVKGVAKRVSAEKYAKLAVKVEEHVAKANQTEFTLVNTIAAAKSVESLEAIEKNLAKSWD